MGKKIIIGFQVTNRVKNVKHVQKVLTEYGCYIKTRLGLHEADADVCSPNGLMILETCGPAAKISAMEKALKAIDGLQLKKMTFEA